MSMGSFSGAFWQILTKKNVDLFFNTKYPLTGIMTWFLIESSSETRNTNNKKKKKKKKKKNTGQERV